MGVVHVRNALVAFTAKFKDIGDLSQPQHLIRIVRDAIERGSKNKEKIHKIKPRKGKTINIDIER